mmetsp:Transcript_2149/g.3096  ORF Transcript_2149/g.3096 Transcript_2149/m.3096 type:complete len:252 (+) Transcript_2149:53-808(+)
MAPIFWRVSIIFLPMLCHSLSGQTELDFKEKYGIEVSASEEQLLNTTENILDKAFTSLTRAREFTIPDEEDQEAELKETGGTTYGYILPSGVFAMLAIYNKTFPGKLNGASFYDLGSGAGRGVLAAALLEPRLEICIGVELSESRDQMAREVKSLMPEEIRKRSLFLWGSMLKANTSHGDIIWLSNLIMQKSFQEIMARKLEKEIVPGTMVFASKALPLNDSILPYNETRVNLPMSWNTLHVAHAYEFGYR